VISNISEEEPGLYLTECCMPAARFAYGGLGDGVGDIADNGKRGDP
jgi:hypothetical protein